jgi:hypothetical protein
LILRDLPLLWSFNITFSSLIKSLLHLIGVNPKPATLELRYQLSAISYQQNLITTTKWLTADS